MDLVPCLYIDSLSELQPDSDVNIEEVEIFEEGDFMSPDFDPESLVS